MTSKVQLNFNQIMPGKFINKGKYLLDDVYQSKKIPDIDVINGDNEPRHTFLRVIDETKVNNLMRLLALCYFNNPGQNRERAVLVYGKIFLKHYELEQRILDSFYGADKSDEDEISELVDAAEAVFENAKKKIEQASVPKPLEPKDRSIEIDLTVEDSAKASHQPEEFSELLMQINTTINDKPSTYEVFNWDINNEVLNHLHRRMSRAYGSLLVRDCAKEILSEVKSYTKFKSRIYAETNMEAAQDFLQKRLGRGLSAGQCAYQIFLKYHKGFKEKGLFKPMSKLEGDAKYNGLRRAVKKIRGNP